MSIDDLQIICRNIVNVHVSTSWYRECCNICNVCCNGDWTSDCHLSSFYAIADSRWSSRGELDLIEISEAVTCKISSERCYCTSGTLYRSPTISRASKDERS